MALFSRKSEPKATEVKPAATVVVNGARATDRNLSSVLLKPRITEKAVKQGEHNVYTFIVHKDATKFDVRDAVVAFFKVTPVKVNIVNKSARQYLSRSKGRTVTQKGMKKAYVYLKAGDSIEIA